MSSPDGPAVHLNHRTDRSPGRAAGRSSAAAGAAGRARSRRAANAPHRPVAQPRGGFAGAVVRCGELLALLGVTTVILLVVLGAAGGIGLAIYMYG
ncbi:MULTISPECIES: hypothetical protein [Streptomyces]|uniref:Uncharacterized protein n=1 Tax=Streptomyces silvisoli TaxID=3034235 RepID=A0ABT5ZDS9_9ACTN|nr:MULTISPECIES: hypothetical protein [Streptomyces]MDF3287724.1 hypothetical protein [Streptomyces silvisoli]